MSRPPLLFVHGAANAAWVWEFWRREMTALGWEAIVLDLRGHGRSLPVDFSTVTMDDYVGDVESVASQVATAKGTHPVLVGWSMGGLVSMMYASRHPETPALVLLEPSAPLEVTGRADPEAVRSTPAGAFGPEVYGVYPGDAERSRPAMPELTAGEIEAVLTNSAGALESGFARRQRQRGISITQGSIVSPAMVIYGEGQASAGPERKLRLALYLGADTIALPEASHWGLVYHEAAVKEIAPRLSHWLTRTLGE